MILQQLATALFLFLTSLVIHLTEARALGQGRLEILGDLGGGNSRGSRFIEDLGEVESRKMGWVRWRPDGSNPSVVSHECSPTELEKGLLDAKRVQRQSQFARRFFARCQKHTSFRQSRDLMPTLGRFSGLTYDVGRTNTIKEVRITVADGRKVRGLLAVKPGGEARPLVVLKCGLFCDSRAEVSTLSVLMQLYEESPFHVLTLSNMTSKQFQKENSVPALGGFDEGRQLYHIGHFLRTSAPHSLRSRISSVHLIGVSLGGHAALYASLYDSLNSAPSRPAFDSVMAMCPVVRLEPSMRDLYRDSTVGRIAKSLTLKHLRETLRFIPILGNIINLDDQLGRRELRKGLSDAAKVYYTQWTAREPWDMRPFYGVEITDLDHFWRVNDFLAYASKVERPTWVVAARDDMVVRYNSNTLPLEGRYASSSSSSLQVLSLSKGDHCAFSEAQGWAHWGALMRAHVLAHSGSFADKVWWRSRRLTLNSQQKRNLQLSGDEQHVRQSWRAIKGKSHAELIFQVFAKEGAGFEGGFNSCWYKEPHDAPGDCYREVKLRFSLQQLPVRGLPKPKSKAEAERLTRILNTSLYVMDSRERHLYLTRELPSQWYYRQNL